MKKKFIIFLLFYIYLSSSLFSQNTFQDIAVNVSGSTTWVRNDSLPNYSHIAEVIVDVTAVSSVLNEMAFIYVKLGSSQGATDLFNEKISFNKNNTPINKVYFETNQNKCYLKVYLYNILHSAVKNYTIQFENLYGQVSSVYTGSLPQ